MAERRVVVTGAGVLACNGSDTASYWDALLAGRHGIGPITAFDTEGHATTFGGQVDLDDVALADGDARTARRKDRFVLMALSAARQPMAQAGFAAGEWEDPFRCDTVVGSGIGGLSTIDTEYRTLTERGPRRVSPFLVPRMIVDSAAGDISIVYGAKGPNYCITTACATATHCIGAAMQHIRWNHCDVMITGGAEAPLTPLGIAGFNNIKALSTRNDDPGRASRPFDAGREGFVIAEGAGILVLEELEHAKARGVPILGELSGYGATADAYHITAPPPDGHGAERALRRALQTSGLQPADIGYVNAHGTSTPMNDKFETMALKKVLGEAMADIPVSSTKSLTGHTLGAAGGIESIVCLLAIANGKLPGTYNYTTPDPDCDLDYIPNQTREAAVDHALCLNFGFGGHNAVLAFSRYRAS